MAIAMTFDDLRRILVACAGEIDQSLAAKFTPDAEFHELGYDSLALIEATSRIEQEFGVTIPDSVVVELNTPRQILDKVQELSS